MGDDVAFPERSEGPSRGDLLLMDNSYSEHPEKSSQLPAYNVGPRSFSHLPGVDIHPGLTKWDGNKNSLAKISQVYQNPLW